MALCNLVSLCFFSDNGYLFMAVLDLHCCAPALSNCGERGRFSSCSVQASHGSGFSCCGAGSLEHAGFSSCGPQAELLLSIWGLPRPGIRLVDCIARWILNRWTIREAPQIIFFSNNFLIELPEPFIFSGCLFGMCGGARQQNSKTLCDKWGFCAHLNNIPRILQGLKFKFGPLSKQFGEVLLHPYRCCSVTRLCLTLCDPTDYSIPGFPALHHLPEFAQAPVH